jgi:hypothetical protein
MNRKLGEIELYNLAEQKQKRNDKQTKKIHVPHCSLFFLILILFYFPSLSWRLEYAITVHDQCH